ncbi:MAG: tetratricopeptide repeat protein [Bacteroidales bacterium]
MLKKCLFLLLFHVIFYGSNLYPQQSAENQKKSIEELKKQYLQNKQTHPFLALEFAAQALQLASESSDSLQMAIFYNYLGDSYFDQKSFSLSLDNYFKAYKIYLKAADSINVAYSYINIGAIYSEQNLTSIALTYFYKAQVIFENGKNKHGLSLVLDKIGYVYLKQGKETEALKNFINSHYTRIVLKDTFLTAISNKNIAEVYLVREEYEKAISFLQVASKSFKAIGNYLYIADTDYKIGDIYLYNKEYENALKFYNSSLENYLKYDKLHETGQIYNKLGKTYLALNKLDFVKKYANEALKIANNSDYLDVKADAYDLLSEYYEKKKDLKRAFRFEKMQSAAADSLSEEKNLNQSAEMQVSFELQMQENKFQIVTKDNELSKITIRNQKFLGLGIAIVTFMLLILAINLYRSNISKKKTNFLLTTQKKDIEEKNHVLEEQKAAIEEINNKIQKINNNITSSINYASRIQQAMLPKPGIYRKYFKDAFVLFKPREVVSGDFYWFTRDEESQRVFIAAVDCTGHGVPGAFMSLIGNTYLNQIVNAHHITDADIILNKLHENIRSSLHQAKNQSRDGMDIALCIIDYKNNIIEFAGARNPLVYIKNNEIFQLRGDNMDIGGIQRETERRFTKQTISLEKGMQLYLFSDGFQDQFGGPDRQKFMRKNFKELLYKVHTYDMMIQMQLIEENFEKWTTMPDGTKLEQIDDILIIGIKI